MPTASPTPDAAAPTRTIGVMETVRTVGLGLSAALLLRVVFYQPFTIPSSSMEPGLVTGDYILVSKFSYGWSRASLPFSPPVFDGRLFGRAPARGDVVVFRATDDLQKIVVKRVIGAPGDRVQVRDGAVLVNGRPLAASRPRLALDRDAGLEVLERRERAPGGRTYRTFDRGPGHEGDDTGVFTVPAGRYFLMGDNRDNSLDSRWPPEAGGMGLVPAENLVGEAQLVLLSLRPGASLWRPWTWFSLAGDRFGRLIR